MDKSRSDFNTFSINDYSDLCSVLTPERIGILDCNDKENALRCVSDLLATAPDVTNAEELTEGIFYREQLMSTGIGLGIAVPHVRLESVQNPAMAVGISREGIHDYESLDNAPVHLIFMIAAGKDQHKQYLRLLSAVSARLKDDGIRQALMNADDGKHFHDILFAEAD